MHKTKRKTNMDKVKVFEVCKLHERNSVSISENINVENLISLIAGGFANGPLFIINSQLQFVGLIRKSDLIRWVYLHTVRGQGGNDYSVWEFFRFIYAKKVVDLVRVGPEVAVKENDSLQVALTKMLDNREDVLPIIDSEKRIIGDLSLRDIIAWVHKARIYL